MAQPLLVVLIITAIRQPDYWIAQLESHRQLILVRMRKENRDEMGSGY